MGNHSAQEPESGQDLHKIVIQEVDTAREVFQLAQQLAPALPIRSFADVLKALGPEAVFRFRGHEIPAAIFAQRIPAYLFPIDSLGKLVVILHEAVRRAPRSLTYPPLDPTHARIELHRKSVLGVALQLKPGGTGGHPITKATPSAA